MPSNTPEKILLPCPHCGHRQPEPRAVVSTICKRCGRHYSVEDLDARARRRPPVPKNVRHVACFECGANLEVPAAAQSTMCKRCGGYVDLGDYRITSAISKNFKTKGRFVIEPRGYVFNTETVVGDAVIKGRFLGSLVVEHSLAVYSTAEIKGRLRAAEFIVPAENHFRCKQAIEVVTAEIAGELAGDLRAEQTVRLRSTARLFGDVAAQNLVVEEGAVFVGHARIGCKRK